jgi:hypothetical protein
MQVANIILTHTQRELFFPSLATVCWLLVFIGTIIVLWCGGRQPTNKQTFVSFFFLLACLLSHPSVNGVLTMLLHHQTRIICWLKHGGLNTH